MNCKETIVNEITRTVIVAPTLPIMVNATVETVLTEVAEIRSKIAVPFV